jgi:hypothetical protein
MLNQGRARNSYHFARVAEMKKILLDLTDSAYKKKKIIFVENFHFCWSQLIIKLE